MLPNRSNKHSIGIHDLSYAFRITLGTKTAGLGVMRAAAITKRSGLSQSCNIFCIFMIIGLCMLQSIIKRRKLFIGQ